MKKVTAKSQSLFTISLADVMCRLFGSFRRLGCKRQHHSHNVSQPSCWGSCVTPTYYAALFWLLSICTASADQNHKQILRKIRHRWFHHSPWPTVGTCRVVRYCARNPIRHDHESLQWSYMRWQNPLRQQQ